MVDTKILKFCHILLNLPFLKEGDAQDLTFNKMEIQSIKQRYNIIGDDPQLNHALDTALQVASTDLSVLVTGESGVGKEVIPQIIHNNSPRKHGPYIAVNCGAIPEGTMDSELFGHEKGAFTGAIETRKGYFEVANGGTIFLDEVADLPMATQVRLLRVLQSGEFIKVGSSKVQKTNVRVVAATNVNIQVAMQQGKFREDLYYRLATIPISIPALRERKGDIYLLFRKFAVEFADKNHIPPIKLTRDAQLLLTEYRWPGNIRQLKSVAEQISILETDREIDDNTLSKYLPTQTNLNLPVLTGGAYETNFMNDRELIFTMIGNLKKDIEHLKSRISSLSAQGVAMNQSPAMNHIQESKSPVNEYIIHEELQEDEQEDNLSIQDKNIELIKKCLKKHGGKRRPAAKELGISERTLYRKILEHGLKDIK